MKNVFIFWFKVFIFDKVVYKYFGEYFKVFKILYNMVFNIIFMFVGVVNNMQYRYMLIFSLNLEEFRYLVVDYFENNLILFVEFINGRDLLVFY